MEKKKEDNDLNLDKKVEPVFGIHKMPKNYKIGRFDEIKKIDSIDSSEIKKPPKTESNNKKKLVFILIIAGVIFVLFLAYLVFSYIKNPNFSLFNFSKSNDSAEVKNQEPLIKTENIITEPENNTSTIENQFNEEETATSSEEITDIIDENLILEEENAGNILYAFLDSDNDGLSDEEENIFLTNVLEIDSDNDNFSDLTEVLNLYNPAGTGALINNENIKEYKNNSFNYSFLYPEKWEMSVLSDSSSVIFSINDVSFIQVLVERNDEKQDIKNWYSSRFFDNIDDLELINKNNWSGVYSEDKLAFYLIDKSFENVYTILYNPSINQSYSHINIFQMIVNSFDVK